MIYDIDINHDHDRIHLYRKGKLKHVWTKEEATHIRDQITKFLLVMEQKPACKP